MANSNRIIKFRVWDNNFKHMLLANDIKFVDGRMIGAKGVNWDSKVAVMQYTGLHDKNGVEIYEGDVYIALNNKKMVVEMPCIYYEEVEGYFSYKTIEVIGNIYQNPELLGDK